MSHSPEVNEAGECVAAIDWLGHRFKVGDRVMYCIGAGRGQLMAIGTVVKIENKGRGVAVQVLTERTSGTWGKTGQRTRPAWVNSVNITVMVGPL